MKKSSVAATIFAIAADIDMACRPVTAAATPLHAARVAPRIARDGMLSRFLLAVARNCGIAIVISVFFATARSPSHVPVQAKHLAAVIQHVSIDAGARNDHGGSKPSVRQ